MTDIKLTRSQREVLKMVAKQGQTGTTVRTSYSRVSGTSAAALVRMGLLQYVAHRVRGVTCGFDVDLTDEGHKVVATL